MGKGRKSRKCKRDNSRVWEKNKHWSKTTREIG